MKIIFLYISFSFFSLIFCQNMYTLYGFKIGQNINIFKNELGNPVKIHKFDDGFVAYLYQFKGYNVIFETDNTRPDLIFNIQIQGFSNPDNRGLGNCNLGDSELLLNKCFGKPDKITDIKNLLDSIRKKNINEISKYISTNFSLHKDKTSITIDNSYIKSFDSNKILHDAFFHVDYGLITLAIEDISQSAMRLEEDSTGYVFKAKKNKLKYEFYFIESYEGWVLKTLYIEE